MKKKFAIEVKSLNKTFKTKGEEKGILNNIKSIFKPSYIYQKAITNLSFSIEEGEKIGFIGPNGAGKSTMIKIMTGLLIEDSGSCHVLGLNPFRNRNELIFQLGVIFGQKTSLVPSLSIKTSFEMRSHLYEIEKGVFLRRLKELVEIFELEKLLTKEPRELSLGERMRCEITASLLHVPKI